MVGALGQADLGKSLGDSAATFGAGEPQGFQAHVDVLVRSERRDQVEPLEDEAHLGRSDTSEFRVRGLCQVDIPELDCTRGRTVECAQHLEEG